MRTETATPARAYGVCTDYETNRGKVRDYLTVWTGGFMSDFVAWGVSLPKGDGYMLTLDWTHEKVRVACPTPRTDDNYLAVDAAIEAALQARDRPLPTTTRGLTTP